MAEKAPPLKTTYEAFKTGDTSWPPIPPAQSSINALGVVADTFDRGRFEELSALAAEICGKLAQVYESLPATQENDYHKTKIEIEWIKTLLQRVEDELLTISVLRGLHSTHRQAMQADQPPKNDEVKKWLNSLGI